MARAPVGCASVLSPERAFDLSGTSTTPSLHGTGQPLAGENAVAESAFSSEIPATKMERSWSLAGATSGNGWQMARPRKPLKQAKSVAVGCHRLSRASNGKEGVDGSSPSEGFDKMPANGHFVVVCPNNTRVRGGYIPGTRDALRSRATSGGTVHQMGVDEFVDEVPANRPHPSSRWARARPPSLQRGGHEGSVAAFENAGHTAGRHCRDQKFAEPVRFRPLSQLTVRFRVELRRSVRDEGRQGVRRLCGAPVPSGWLGRMRSR